MPIPAIRRPTVRRLCTRSARCIKQNEERDIRRAADNDHLKDDTNGEKDDGREDTALSTRVVTQKTMSVTKSSAILDKARLTR